MLAVPLAVLPLAVNPRLLRGGEANPVLDVLTLLSVSVGLPFLVVSATAPLLQKWFTQTGHPAARDPYFLYAASNLGSMLALLGYPDPRRAAPAPAGLGLAHPDHAVEPRATASLACSTALCALTLWWKPARAPARRTRKRRARRPPAEPGPAGRGGSTGSRWPSCPRACCSASTTYITTDLAAVPLLWVLPLAIYLLTFILAFGRWPRALHRLSSRSPCPSSCVVIFLMVSALPERIWVTVLWHFGLLFVHRARLPRRPRPRPARARAT